MPLIIVFVIALIVGLAFPAGVGLVLFLGDLILPDPIPFIDEVGIGLGVIVRAIRSARKAKTVKLK